MPQRESENTFQSMFCAISSEHCYIPGISKGQGIIKFSCYCTAASVHLEAMKRELANKQIECTSEHCFGEKEKKV